MDAPEGDQGLQAFGSRLPSCPVANEVFSHNPDKSNFALGIHDSMMLKGLHESFHSRSVRETMDLHYQLLWLSTAVVAVNNCCCFTPQNASLARIGAKVALVVTEVYHARIGGGHHAAGLEKEVRVGAYKEPCGHVLLERPL